MNHGQTYFPITQIDFHATLEAQCPQLHLGILRKKDSASILERDGSTLACCRRQAAVARERAAFEAIAQRPSGPKPTTHTDEKDDANGKRWPQAQQWPPARTVVEQAINLCPLPRIRPVIRGKRRQLAETFTASFD
jgi:hypothetical protein